MTLYEALVKFLASLAPHAGTIAGFASAWLIFEITDWRRRRMQIRMTRDSLIAELRSLEWVLGSTVVERSFGTNDSERGVKELRRYFSKGRERGRIRLMPPGIPEKMLEKTDEELAAFLKSVPPSTGDSAIDLPTPVLSAVLATPASGFTQHQIEKLSELRWQFYILENDVRWLNKYLELSFSVDTHNHAIVIDNHEKAKRSYRLRVDATLLVLREALQALSANNT